MLGREGDGMLRDDRGTPIQIQSAVDVLETVEPVSAERSAWRRIAAFIGPAYLIGFFLWRGWSWSNLIFIGAATLIVLAVNVLVRFNAGDTRKRRMYTLLRAARCGACGFSLLDLTVHADNCVTCPECAAAWNRDRWHAQSGQAGSQSKATVRLALTQGPNPSYPKKQADDRGAMLARPMVWPPKWRKASMHDLDKCVLSVQHASRLRAFQADAARSISKAWWLYITIVGLFIAMILVVSVNSQFMGFLAAVPALLFGALFAMLAFERTRRSVDVRAVALRHGLCPACGNPLDLAAPLQFDGCTQCAACASAWKAPDAHDLERELPHAAPVSFAYRLGRALSLKGRRDE